MDINTSPSDPGVVVTSGCVPPGKGYGSFHECITLDYFWHSLGKSESSGLIFLFWGGGGREECIFMIVLFSSSPNPLKQKSFKYKLKNGTGYITCSDHRKRKMWGCLSKYH